MACLAERGRLSRSTLVLRRWGLPLALLSLRVLPLVADPVPVHAKKPLRVTRIDSAAGLSHNSVYAVLRDRHGFVWVGTPDGLNRFDGYEVRRFHHDPDDRHALSHQVVRCLLEDRQGALWIGTGNALNRLDRTTNRFSTVRLGDGAHDILSLFEDRHGALWVGTTAGAYRRASATGSFAPVPHVPEGHVRDFASAPDGAVWALVQRGAESALHALDGSGQTLGIAQAWGWVTNFAIDRSGSFWLKPPHAARVNKRVLEPASPVERALVVNRIRLSGDAVWMATDRGLCTGSTAAGVSCRAIDASATWLENFVRDLWIDDEGAVWSGTYAGLVRFDPTSKPFETWTHDQRDPRTISSDAVSSLVADDDGTLWAGTFGGGLNRLDRGRGEATRFRAGPGALPHDTIWALLLAPDGALWIGTEEGLASFDPAQGMFVRHALPFPADEREGRRTTALARDPQGVIWIAAAGGLYSYDPRTRAARRHPLADAENIAAIHVDADGTVWTGTGAVGLKAFDPASGTFRDYPRLTKQGARLTSEGFWDIHADGRDSLWIATGMGLSRFDRRTKTYENFLPRDGLPASMIYSIAADRRGRLWLGTSRGLVRFDPDAPRDRRFRTFGLSDGLAGLEFNRHAATRTKQGELCFGGIGGLTCFDPERIEDDRRPPRIALTAIELAEGTKMVAVEPFGRQSLELRHDHDPFGFTFAALSFADPQRNQYQYQLEGFDRGWIDAGTRRVARYTNVPPGRYVFRVQAANADQTWNRQGVAMAVRILPPFWMTWWFRALVLAMVVGLIYALHRYRVSRLLELERLRLRIAGDLHDEVTSELSGISMLAELARRRHPEDAAAETQLGALRDRASSLASVMRDLAWGIHPEHDTTGATLRRMRSTGAMLLGETPLHIETEELDDDAPLPMLVRRTLYLVCKEALHNAAKHAAAGQVRIHLRAQGNELEMTVTDDGSGFDPAAVPAGDGLRNMRRRVSDARGEIDVQSGPGRGTTIFVRVPVHPSPVHEDS